MEKESCDYPVSYSYAAAQMVTGADQYEKVEIEDPDYLKAQERTRLLSFYLDSGAGRNPSEACLVAFQPEAPGRGRFPGGCEDTSGRILYGDRVNPAEP